MFGGCLFWFFVLITYMTEQHGIVRYDCSLAEISPDFPLQVKEDCRKLRLQYKENHITNRI